MVVSCGRYRHQGRTAYVPGGGGRVGVLEGRDHKDPKYSRALRRRNAAGIARASGVRCENRLLTSACDFLNSLQQESPALESEFSLHPSARPPVVRLRGTLVLANDESLFET
jgi:hypothetical protein